MTVNGTKRLIRLFLEIWALVLQLLLGIQDLLNDPNASDPAQVEAYTMFKFVSLPVSQRTKNDADLSVDRNDKVAYERRIKQQAKERVQK